MKPIAWAAVAVAASVALAAACNDPVTGNAVREGVPGLDFNLDPASSRGAASGSAAIRSYELASLVSPFPTDAFNRSGATGSSIGYGGCVGLSTTNTRCWSFRDWTRVGAPADGPTPTDPRLPLLDPLPGRDSVGFCAVGGPEYFNSTTIKAFEIFCRVFGASPSQPYFMSMARYGLQVRGQLDQIERLVYGTVTQPDSLVLLNPNPGGFPTTNYNWVSNAACTNLLVVRGTNPLHLGPATATTAGQLTFDKCFGSGDLYYRNAAATVPDSSPFVRNAAGAVAGSHQYNYIEIRAGNTPDGPLVARVQVGADLDPTTGAVIPNAFAPFPAAALTPGTLISVLDVAEGGPSAISATFVPLEPLDAGKTYKIVLVNRHTGQLKSIRARYRTVKTDTTGFTEEGKPITTVTTSAFTSVSEIAGAAANVAHYLEPADSLNAGTRLRDFTDLALQLPSETEGVPIWFNYRLDPNKTSATATDDQFIETGTVVMGTLPVKADAAPYIFRAGGSASGTNRGSQLGISFSRLPRPPIGYYYNAWLIPSVEAGKPAGVPVSIGPIRTPLPELASLEDADMAPAGGVMSATQILEANVLLRPTDVSALGSGQLKTFDRVRLTLEAKDGTAAISPIVVLEGPLPNP